MSNLSNLSSLGELNQQQQQQQQSSSSTGLCAFNAPITGQPAALNLEVNFVAFN